MDDAEIGEFAYDYVELTRDVLNGDAMVDDSESKYSGDQDSPTVRGQEKNFSASSDEIPMKVRQRP